MDIPGFVIFSDLDGTLLDHETYRFDAAQPALQEIKASQVPLVLSSSKTRAEIEQVRKQLKNPDPFIVENGGAVYIPKGYFQSEIAFDTQNREDYEIIELGTPYAKLRRVLLEIKHETGLPFTGFGDLEPDDLANITNLPRVQVSLATQREYDEPFFIEGSVSDIAQQQIEKIVADAGLKLTKGGRFYHLTGNNDKGVAVQILVSLFRNECQNDFEVVGIGDSLNDLPMLKLVDHPILVQKPDGTYDELVQSEIKPILANGVGPQGWNEAILRILMARRRSTEK
ncbi:mannosyl-3-phosphoglycerate phosphatase [candidate division KSB1 bacterium]|nr:mannosyl-3-phosphoglycerate phosphatase [candidate division KSB1 bacterium]NIR69552.1 mannosyl-3-phosphoglycerate phosphatase [candidate division KSB1 bacterium]NIS25900.1 mannosyl-3-phosphoglycerate phosphatase [candidate division KSB1 bacterium]NIT72781.1 mannosyl-3-phosphoglycerate phosphatase [candidate division KSB1 bacterium]NIU26588.1 mannosyl-3-phosphoglycerate phosphatase [candidate division KSB1 bacterium]